MPGFDDYLADSLRRRAAAVEIPPGDAPSVMAQGRSLRRRRQTGVAVTAFVAGAGLVAGVLAVKGPEHPSTSVGFATAPKPGPASTQLDWHVAPATSGLSMSFGSSVAGGEFYAVSTSPGVQNDGANVPNALFRSSDGASWTLVRTGSAVSAVAGEGNQLYAVGTGPAAAATSGLGVTLSVSSDGGTSFSGAALPLSLTSTSGGLQVNGLVPQVAAGPSGVVVAVRAILQFDPLAGSPVPPGASGWTATPSGVEVLGALKPDACPAGYSLETSGGSPTTAAPVVAGIPGRYGQIQDLPCHNATGQVTDVPASAAYRITGAYPWAHFGVSPQASAALQDRTLVFFSPDGRTFQQVAAPALEGITYLASGPGGYALAGDSGAVQSADGRTWGGVIPLPGGSEGIVGAGFAGGHLVAVCAGPSTSMAYTLTGGIWSGAQLPDFVGSASFGPLGVAAVGVTKGRTGSWDVLYSPDGTHWSRTDLGSIAGGSVAEANVLVGSSSVVATVTRPPTGAPGQPAAEVAVVGTPAG